MTAQRAVPLQPFEARVSSSAGEVRITLHGELDAWTQPRFAMALTSLVDARAEIVLDLSELTFIDAGNIGLIHRARNLARLRGADLVIRSANPQVSRVMNLAGLTI